MIGPIELFKIGIAILQSVSEWQHDKVDWSSKNAHFSSLIDCHGKLATSLEKPKKLNEVNKLFHPLTNPESLVKIGPLGSELPGVDH